MTLAHKLDYPNNESELRLIQDKMFELTKQSKENPIGFKGLLEIVSSETTIMTAIHNIKGNTGSQTPGVDERTIDDYLQKEYQELVDDIQDSFQNYRPDPIRRKYIDKESGEKRPLGIPTMRDRIIQECIRIVIEPIAEGIFFNHSYGFRPMRDQKQAIARVEYLVHHTECCYAIEGDIKGFFDNVNHTILLKQLYHIGVKDRRLLMIIKSMLKAEIIDGSDSIKLDRGTPQGGILSPLLANVYLNTFDRWITREWETNKQNVGKSTGSSAFRTMRKRGMKPVYLIRYADDWIILTNSRSNAELIKYKSASFLRNQLNVELSMEKTKITNLRRSRATFLGFDIKITKMVRTAKGTKSITKTSPNPKRMEIKLKQLRMDAYKLRMCRDKKTLADRIINFNAKIRGIINYYEAAATVNRDFQKYSWRISKVLFHSVRKQLAKTSIPANQTNNLLAVHSRYTTRISFLEIEDVKIGITSLSFATYTPPAYKNQQETPYTERGRSLNTIRKNKTPLLARADSFVNPITISKATRKKQLYNYEFFMNRAYAYNRDRGKCRVCSAPVFMANFHHIKPYLSLYEVNKVSNIATVHDICHNKIHSGDDYSYLPDKLWKKIQKFREYLSKRDEITVSGN